MVNNADSNNHQSQVPEPPARFGEALAELETKFEEVGWDFLGGDAAEKIIKPFTAEFGAYLAKLPLCVKILDPSCSFDVTKFPTSGSQNELLNDDFKILTRDKRVEIATPSYASAAAAVYWRASQAAYIRLTCNGLNGGVIRDPEDRVELLELSRRALYYDPNAYLVLRAHMCAIGLFHERPGLSPRDKCFIGIAFREACGRCIEARPDDYLGHSMLGRYYYTLATMPWWQRILSKNFTTVKFDGGLAEAEREFRIAHKCRPNWLPTGLLMARCLLELNRPVEEVREWIEFGLAQESMEATTALEKQQLIELRTKVDKQFGVATRN